MGAAHFSGPVYSANGFVAGTEATPNLVADSATPGTVYALVGAYTTYTTMTSGNVVGARGAVTLGGPISSNAYVYGLQGKITTGANAITGKTAAAVYAQFDVTGGSVASGDSAGVVALITGATATGGNGAGEFPGLDGIYVENVGGGNVHSVVRFLGGADYALDLTDGGVAPFVIAAGSGGTGSAGYAGGAGIPTKVLKCYINGAAMYIPCYSTNA